MNIEWQAWNFDSDSPGGADARAVVNGVVLEAYDDGSWAVDDEISDGRGNGGDLESAKADCAARLQVGPPYYEHDAPERTGDVAGLSVEAQLALERGIADVRMGRVSPLRAELLAPDDAPPPSTADRSGPAPGYEVVRDAANQVGTFDWHFVADEMLVKVYTGSPSRNAAAEVLARMLATHAHAASRAAEPGPRVRQTFQDALQESLAHECEAHRTTQAFLSRTTQGGSIVSSNTLTPEAIAIARASDRLLVIEDGLGFVYVPGPMAFREVATPSPEPAPEAYLSALHGSGDEDAPVHDDEAAEPPWEARIYTASKTRHAPKWLALRASGAPIISTWIDEAGPGEPASFSDLWIRCVREASTATALVVFAEDGDVLKGGFVEVGAALASEVPVFAVGAQPGWSFANHPLVTKCETIDAAFRLALARAPAAPSPEPAPGPRVRVWRELAAQYAEHPQYTLRDDEDATANGTVCYHVSTGSGWGAQRKYELDVCYGDVPEALALAMRDAERLVLAPGELARRPDGTCWDREGNRASLPLADFERLAEESEGAPVKRGEVESMRAKWDATMRSNLEMAGELKALRDRERVLIDCAHAADAALRKHLGDGWPQEALAALEPVRLWSYPVPHA